MALAVIAEEPTVTPIAVPTTAPLSVPTATPLPTATPAPIATAVPTATVDPTPAPTSTPQPTAIPATAVPATPIPEPTATLALTPTPEPTATLAPTPAPMSEPATKAAGEGGPPASHVVAQTGFLTLGQAGAAVVLMPAALIELIGFHEASHPGAQAINLVATDLPSMLLGSRGRGTPARSAADIVVPPGEPLRAPVTGTVVAARQYVLYCEHQDSLVYIEPDGMPGWQVRLFHVQGELPLVGAGVIAGETVVATGGANPLPFESQIDAFTAEPSWPHAHLEVVDTNVPDDRPPGGGC